MRGFTFLEIIVVIAITLIVGGTTALFGIRFFLDRQTALTVQLVRTSLMRANMYALSGREENNWGVIQSGQNLIIFSGENFSERQTDLDEIVPLPKNVNLSSFGEIIFRRPQGTTEQSTIQILSSTKNITLLVTSEGAVIEL